MDTEHLGGAMPADPASYYPQLWDFLHDEFGVKTVLDVGCGEGQALAYFRNHLGCRVLGIDGLPQHDPDVRVHDYTRGPLIFPPRRVDLCWSCEFVEHVEERFAEHFLTSFDTTRLLLMTHATPGQIGHHHVNCQPSSYWIEKLEARGFEYDPWLTIACRELAAAGNGEPRNYFARTGLALRRSG